MIYVDMMIKKIFLSMSFFLYISDSLRDDMYQRHMQELERKSKEHEAHMQTARMELERAVEISKQKVKLLRILLYFVILKSEN